MDTAAAAATIAEGFELHQAAFASLTRQARRRFEWRDWRGMQRDARARLDLYRGFVDSVLRRLPDVAGGLAHERAAWPRIREAYAGRMAGRGDRELAETFFNSVVRRRLATVGVDTDSEFLSSAAVTATAPVHETLRRDAGTRELALRLLRRLALSVPFASLEKDAEAMAEAIDSALGPWRAPGILEAFDFVPTLFFRGKAAYVVGRLRGREGARPLILALLHEGRGVFVDAVLLDEDAASIVFGFTHAYFHVETPQPAALVEFLASLLPRKRRAELYTSLGYHKHGKTELYRDLMRYLRSSSDRFEVARGERGMVMIVFTLPGYEQVFKVIRDRFAEPKRITREGVMAKYALVFHHDRAGRLIDAQEFEHLSFPRERFEPGLLAELLGSASESVALQSDAVVIRHLYVERRLLPLNLYLREAEYQAARLAVLDYGQAIRDLAATDIFPGDVLLKNFGLTRHGRVVFYDYDELARLTDCRFRSLPPPPGPEEEMAAEPWFHVADDDVFPEEFRSFLGLPGRLREVFLEAHGDLLAPGFWRGMQERIRSGEIVDIFPYTAEQRLRRFR